MTSGVSIVIPNWNGRELLERFLPSVIAATIQYNQQFEAPVEIVLVDDGSEDESVEWLLAHGFQVESQEIRIAREPAERGTDLKAAAQTRMPILKVLRNEVNRGFGAACNSGFEYARYPLVFLLNNDVEIDVNAIAPLVEKFADASVFAVHCRVFDLESGRECGNGKLGSFSRGFIRVHRSYVCLAGSPDDKEPEPSEGSRYSIFASGGSAMFDRRIFLDIGGFDSLFAPGYWEDVDISYRAWKRGLSVLYEPRSVVRHRVSSTMRMMNQRGIQRLQQRNRLIYHWVNLHDGTMLASHIMWVAFLTFAAPLRFQLSYILSVIAALKKLSLIRKRREQEKRSARRSDRDVFNIFATLEARPDLFAYDTYAELEAISSPQHQSREVHFDD